MADLIQNVQEVFKKWEAKGTSNFNSRGRRGHVRGFDRSNYGRGGGYSDSFSSYSHSRDNGFKQHFRTSFSKRPKYDCLAQFKMAPSIAAENKQRPFTGSCCSKCLPLSRASVADSRVYSLSICNILHIPHFQCLDFRVVFNILKKKRTSLYPDVSVAVLQSKGVLNAIQDTVNDCTEESVDCDKTHSDNVKIKQLNRAKKFLDRMKSSISATCLYVSSLCLHSVFSRIFDGILVHKGQLEILKTISQEDPPIVYLPLYQSNLDYALISFILYMNSLKVPLVPTDQDLYIPIFRFVSKLVGAFFIRNYQKKSYSETDSIYAAVLQNYITECLKADYNLQFAIDKECLLSNKHFNTFDLLPVVVGSVLKGTIEDINISTVSISYEKFHVENFINKQLGQPIEKETVSSFIYSIWKMMHMKFGNIRVNFGQPFSVKEFLQSSENYLKCKIPITDTPPTSPAHDECVSVQEKFESNQLQQVTKILAKHVVYDLTVSTSLMSTHLLAFLLITQYRKGATQQQLQNSMDWLRGQLSNKKLDTGFTGQSLPVIKRAVELLGKDLISSEVVDMEWTSSDLENNNVKVTIYKPVTKLPHVLELQYYANYVVPVFLLDSITVNALYALVDVEICHFRHCDSQLYVSRDKLIDKSVELSDLLQFEFVPISPCSDITLKFSDAIDELVEKECLHIAGVNITTGRMSRYARKPHTLCFDASDDEDELQDALITKEQQLKIDLTEESINHLEFLRNVLSPCIESYWLSACTLVKLIDEVKEESVFIQEMQQTAQEKLYKGLLAYEESFSAITFRNSIKLFEAWRVIESYEQDGMKIVYLNENYNNKERINHTISRIEEFRK